ncbi:hypothetical protein [Candidatus Nanopelagicus hibericus]|uniref:hypothetical protein n=1 Tax=Candidatus Nanopelagicus hibericus TaxID=1884915 RepID=UPI001CBD2EE6|nr:hypothetical protein [Candidatus Nanopelagicus hibericus]
MAFQAFSVAAATNGAGAPFIGFNAAAFFDFNTGLGGGGIINRFSTTTACALAFGIVEVTEIVVEDPEVEVCNFAGNGLPGPFLKFDFFDSDGFTMLGDRLAIFFTLFLAVGFFTELFGLPFLAVDLAGFFTDDFELFFADFLNNFLIATIPPGGAKVMAWPK